jgi:hypothetical protein
MKFIFTASTVSALLFSGFNSFAQFAPGVGSAGTTAMYKDSSAFVSWATKCTITRGLQDISLSSGAYANVGDSSSALGKAGTTGVVSLGDGGIAVLQFASPVKDDTGPDFAVFENSFDDSFLELGFVEVSSDGSNWFRFPAVSNTDATTQTGSFGATDPVKINNLAGKYRGQYGTPFDLADITDNLLLDKQAITHVKIIDVVGCIQTQYCTRDVNNNKVNDPWPTAFGSGGFDLDAVGVINRQAIILSVQEAEQLPMVTLYPNPATDKLYLKVDGHSTYSVSVFNVLGELVLQSENSSSMMVNELPEGVYTLEIVAGNKRSVQKFIKAVGSN